MPVWQFNDLQLAMLYILNSRRKAAKEMETMTMISALFGNQTQTKETFLKMIKLNHPEREIEDERFEEESKGKFERMMQRFNSK